MGNSDPMENPYAPPITPDAKYATSTQSSKWLRGLSGLSALNAIICCFAFVSACWEITHLTPNSYGPNTGVFRASYIRVALVSMLTGCVAIAAVALLLRGRRSGVVLATLAIFITLTAILRVI